MTPSQDKLSKDKVDEFVKVLFDNKPIFRPGQKVMLLGGTIKKITGLSDTTLIVRDLYFYEKFYAWIYRVFCFNRIKHHYLGLMFKIGLKKDL